MIHALILLAAAAQPAGPKPILDKDYPTEARQDLTVVADDVLACCRQLWPGKPPAGERPIVIRHRAAGPLTDATADPNVYRIYLTVTTRAYTQLAYQLAHEFAHIMLDPRRTNGLVEVLAVAFSLRVLDEMSARWRAQPPFPHWKEYAPSFAKYRQQAEKEALATFPLSVQALVERKDFDALALYLRHRRKRLQTDTADRNLQHLASLALLTPKVRWGDLVGVAGLTDPPPSKDGKFRSDLPLDPAHIPTIFQRVGIGRTLDLLSAEFAEKPDLKSGVVLRVGARSWLWLREAKPADAAELDKLIRARQPVWVKWEKGTR